MRIFFTCLLSWTVLLAMLPTMPAASTHQVTINSNDQPFPGQDDAGKQVVPQHQLVDNLNRDRDASGNLAHHDEAPPLFVERKLGKKPPAIKDVAQTGGKTAPLPQRVQNLTPRPTPQPSPKPTPNPPTLQPTRTFDGLSIDERYSICVQHYRKEASQGKGSSSSKGGKEDRNGAKGGKSGSGSSKDVREMVAGVTKVRSHSCHRT